MRKKEDENENGQTIATGSDQQRYNKDALIVLSRRSNGHCGVTPNGTTSSIGFGFDFNCVDGNVNSKEMREVNIGFNMQRKV